LIKELNNESEGTFSTWEREEESGRGMRVGTTNVDGKTVEGNVVKEIKVCEG
jgi:hypothetical protein